MIYLQLALASSPLHAVRPFWRYKVDPVTLKPKSEPYTLSPNPARTLHLPPRSPNLRPQGLPPKPSMLSLKPRARCTRKLQQERFKMMSNLQMIMWSMTVISTSVRSTWRCLRSVHFQIKMFFGGSGWRSSLYREF